LTECLDVFLLNFSWWSICNWFEVNKLHGLPWYSQ